MKNKKIICTILFSLLATIFIFAEKAVISDAEPLEDSSAQESRISNDPNFLSEKEEHLEQKKDTALTVQTNVTSANVYLNGNYRGTTPLTIKNLTPGKYKLRVEKQHYQTREINVNVKRGQRITYNIDLVRIIGKIYFNVNPSNATVQCDGTMVNSNICTVDEGSHNVTVKCFGYRTWSSSVSVIRNTIRKVSVELEEAPFEISSIYSSKSSFNPKNAGSLGTTDISFSVTAPASGILTIRNNYGEEFFRTGFSNFATWNYSSSWNGKKSDGTFAPNGVYTATLEAGGQTSSCSFKIDSSISYPALSLTYDGSGLGSVASAQMYPGNTMMFNFSVGPNFDITNGGLYGVPFKAQFGWAAADWFEFATSFKLMFGTVNTTSLNLTAKFGGSALIFDSAKLCYALNFRFGSSSKGIYFPYGADVGNGLGTGLMAGLDIFNFYIGFASEFIYKPVVGTGSKGDDLAWKNGIIIQHRSTSAALGIFASVDSCFGSYNYEDDDNYIYSGTIYSLTRAVDSGVEGSMYFPNSSVAAVGRIGIIWYPLDEENQLYQYGEIGISIVF